MSGSHRRRLALILSVLALPLATPATGQDQFTAERLVRMEAFGAVQITPSGRWVTLERRGAYDSARSYVLGQFAAATITDLVLVDTTGEAPDRVIGEDEPDGYQIGPVSPDETRMAVFRQRGSVRDLGVLTFATGELQWFDVTPDLPVLGRTIAWRGPDELLVLATAPGRAPLYHRLGSGAQDRMTALWRTMAEGHTPSVTQVWSGEDRDRRPHSDPGRLVRVTVSGRKVETLATGAFVDMELSPDGTHLAALGSEADLQPAADTPITVGTPTRRRRLTLVDLTTGRIADPLPERDVLSHLLVWSPDSGTLLVFARPLGAPWTDGEAVSVRATGEAEPLRFDGLSPALLATAGEKTPYARAAWTNDGPVVLVEVADGRRAWSTPSGARSASRRFDADPLGRFSRRQGRLWFAGQSGLAPWAEGEPSTPLSAVRSSTASTGSRSAWNPTDHEAGATALRDAANCLRAEPLGKPALCSAEAVTVASIDGRVAVALTTDRNGVGRATLRTSAGAREFEVINEHLASVDWPSIREAPHLDRTGAPVSSWLLLPPGSPPSGGWPIILSIYPGRVHASPPGVFRPGSEMSQLSPLVLASAGYAVLVPILDLTPADGGAMPDLSERLIDILAAADQVADLDTRRVAVMGHSFGGQAALRVATQTNQFQAIVASAGLADLGSAIHDTPYFRTHPEDGVYSNPTAGYFESGQGAMGSLPWEDPQAYTDASPLYRAGRISTPVLMIAGDQDPVVAEAMFAALYRRNADASLITYWGEGHNLVSPANIVDLHARMLEWLADKLGPPVSRSGSDAPTADPSIVAPRAPAGPG